MKSFGFRFISLFFLLSAVVVARPTLADEPVPITADAAFDAVAMQTDPITGDQASVALVDVRTRAEYFWVGAAAQVDEIVLKDHSVIKPDLGKVQLIWNGWFLKFKLNGRTRLVPVNIIDHTDLSPLAINVPFKLWQEADATLVNNPNFANDIGQLIQDGVQVVILFCRSGGRSTACVGDVTAAPVFDMFKEVYEIDDPAGTPGRGGFQGSDYRNVYNGYLGFPSRPTKLQDVPSVSWKDSGLPMKTLLNPVSQPQ
jgi:rhodanese-related sulfurtransferase